MSSIENDVKVILDKRKDNLKNLSERCQCSTDKGELSAALEYILPEPRYAGFLETAFALSEQGLVGDLSFFKSWCGQVAEDIAGSKIENTQDFVSDENFPKVLKMAFNALLNGISVFL